MCPELWRRYCPALRMPHAVDTSTAHMDFRHRAGSAGV
jgi:hypothetical protein